MFVGHYGAALALRTLPGSPSLPALFVGVQVLDYAFFGLSMLSIERYRIEPGATAMNDLDLFYMPYSHSLLGALGLSLAFGVIVALFSPAAWRWMAGLIAGLSVFSHWLLDFIVHRPDLGILGDAGTKVGLGVWNHPNIAIPLEIGTLLACAALYWFLTGRKGGASAPALGLLLAVLLGLQAYDWLGPRPGPDADLTPFALLALMAYTLAAVLAWWADIRKPR